MANGLIRSMVKDSSSILPVSCYDTRWIFVHG